LIRFLKSAGAKTCLKWSFSHFPASIVLPGYAASMETVEDLVGKVDNAPVLEEI
jgi:hypothetical protein